jgi:hypothetical protein
MEQLMEVTQDLVLGVKVRLLLRRLLRLRLRKRNQVDTLG